jgi:acyl-CoA synthetase (AMP-forming)/AMP-acid ligase II
VNLGLLLEMASGQGDRIALGGTEDGVSFSKLADFAARGAAVISDKAPGHVVLLGRNGPALPGLMFASALAGVPFTPMNYRLSPDQIRQLLSDLDRPMVIADADYLDVAPGSMGMTEFEAAAEQVEPAELGNVADDSPAVMLFTSGTTSKPKIVPLRHENLASYIISTVEYGSADEKDAALVTVPPYHVAAIGSALSNLYAGRRVVYLPDFSAAGWLELARSERVTSAMVVPTMLSRVVEHLNGAPAEVPTLRTLSYGGAKMPRAVLERALKSFPGCDFVNAYGLTETSSTIALLGPEDHRAAMAASDEAGRARLGSAGRPVPGIEMQIRTDDGAVAAAGQVGELWVRGPQVSGEYVGVGSVLDADGWFPTKDNAYIDDEGYLFIEGRSDDTIIRGGENIAPAEIEETLFAHPEVLDAAVVGVPDEEWGERIVAVVVRRSGSRLSEEEMRAWCRSRLRGSRTPDSVVWRAELPYTTTGKLLRGELVASFEQ